MPETVTGYSDASEVMVDPSGKFVLVSNRYTDSIAVYRIDPLTGYMRNVGFTHAWEKLHGSSVLETMESATLQMRTVIPL